MQQLTIEHKKVKKDRRPGKGRSMALSRRIYRLQNTDTFYVESETRDVHYYFCKFKPEVLEYSQCSCKDNSIRRHLKCKHLFAIEFAIKWGTIKDIDKVPSTTTIPTTVEENVKPDNATITITTTKLIAVVATAIGPKSYKDDDYTF